MKSGYIVILLILVVGGLFLVGSEANADCDGSSPGPDNITCDNNAPGAPTTDVEADAGDDTVTVDPGTTVTDDGADGNDNSIEGGPGSDTITNNGSVVGDIEGDGSTHPGGTGADSITNNGTVDTCDGVTADCGGEDGEIEGGPGNDTIINNGSIEADLEGDEGNDSIENTNYVGDDIDGGEDDDIINNGSTGTIDDNISGDDIAGDGGNDTITNDGTVNGDIDGDNAGGNGGNDLIINNGSVLFDIDGDDTFGDGGSDTIINNGTADDILADYVDGVGGNDFIHNTKTGVANNIVGDVSFGGPGGNDTILNEGTVNNYIIGDDACTGGDDLIINSGQAGIIEGDFTCTDSGNDTIIHTGTVDNIYGDEEAFIQGEGNDMVFIRFGSVVTGVIRGNEDAANGDIDFDVITFTDLTQAAADAIAVQCPNPDSGCLIDFAGSQYDVAQFENLQLLLAAVAQALQDAGFVVVDDIGPRLICDDGRVKIYRDQNNDQWVFSGFWLLPEDGFLVARLPHDELFPGNVFSDPGAPPEGQGWTAVLDNTLHTRVFDAAGNLISDKCLYRDLPNDPLIIEYGGQPSSNQ